MEEETGPIVAESKPILQFIVGNRFEVPIFQRTYSWEKTHCQQLWKDIERVGQGDNEEIHFVGSVVYALKGISDGTPLLVIDGQQRLTTLSLILEVLARRLENPTELIKGLSESKIRNDYCLNSSEDGEERYKLILTETDQKILQAILDRSSELPENYSLSNVWKNFKFFEERITKLSDLNPLWRGLNKLMVVCVGLDKRQNNPQQIFERMNSTGKKLNEADLVRNFVLMSLEPQTQNRLYKEHWRPMEKEFGDELVTLFDRFMRDYLTIKNEGVIPKIGDVYEEFKTYRRKTAESMDVATLVQDVRKFAGFYCAIALEKKENDPVLAPAFTDFRELKAKVAYPLLLRLYDDYKNEKRLLDRSEFAQIVQLIVSYIFRRAVCKIPTNTLNKTFATFGKEIDNNRYLESVKDHFLSLESNRRFPNDKEFRDALKERDLYHFQPQNRKYWLLRLENYDRLERISPDEYSIEHIMPQDENLHIEWRNALGNNWKEAHQTWLHRLGNLTLTPTRYNSKYGNHPFAKKRDMEWGYHASPLRLNEGLRQAKKWDVEEIQQRGEYLANLATEVWKAP